MILGSTSNVKGKGIYTDWLKVMKLAGGEARRARRHDLGPWCPGPPVSLVVLV